MHLWMKVHLQAEYFAAWNLSMEVKVVRSTISARNVTCVPCILKARLGPETNKSAYIWPKMGQDLVSSRHPSSLVMVKISIGPPTDLIGCIQ